MKKVAEDIVSLDYRGKSIDLVLPSGTGNVSRVIRKGRFYEKKFLEYIKKLEIEGTYVDVGANIGNHSVYFGVFTKSSKVLSFEPNPKVYDFLTKNIELTRLTKKFESFNVALGDQQGKVSLVIDPSDENGGTRVKKGQDIEQRTLDEFIEHRIGMIKIDVEGYEENVLKGAMQILDKYTPELFVEITSRKQYQEIHNIIKRYGYEPINVFNNTSTYHFSTKNKQHIFYNLTKLYVVRRLLRYS